MFDQWLTQAEAEAAAAGPMADEPLLDPFTDQVLPPRGPSRPLVEPVDEPEPGRSAPLHPLVAGLQAAIAALARAQTDGTLACGSLVDTAALLRAGESVAGLALVEVAAVDRSRAYVVAGRASTAGWLGATLCLSDTAARAKVNLARRLTEDLGGIGDLLVDGGTTVAHCTAMVAGLRGLRPEVIAESVPALVTLARTLDPPTLARELRERALAVSPELAEEQERRQRQRVGLTASELPDGCVAVNGLLSPEGGQTLLAALDAVVHGERKALAEDGEPDDRDASTRRADALVGLAQHALGCEGLLPRQAGTRPTVHVVVRAETLLDEQADSPPARFAGSNALLTRQQLLRLSCDADVSRVVIDSDGLVVDLGFLTRTVTPAQWRALVARDGGCIIRGCRRRHSECQAHHGRHWALGGPSDLANYALVCHYHHHQLHEGGRTLECEDRRWLTPEGWKDTGPPVF